MPLPKIRDGQKLSIMFPGDALARLKSQAADEGTLPSLILLEALDQYWGGDSEAANPTTDLTKKQRKSHAALLRKVEDGVLAGKVTVGEVAKAASVSPAEVIGQWREAGYVPMGCAAAVATFLQSRRLLSNPKKP